MSARIGMVIGAVSLIAVQVWVALFLTPSVTLTIPIKDAYETVDFGRVTAVALVGAIIAAVPVIALSTKFTPSRLAISLGSVCTVFVFVGVFVGIAYIGLYDDNPDNFRRQANWILRANFAGSLLLPAGLIALAVGYFRRTWRPQSSSREASARA